MSASWCPANPRPRTLPRREACAEWGAGQVGLRPKAVVVQGRRHLVWRCGDSTRVLLVEHCDTVWPMGPLTRWPFTVIGDRAAGPAVFDMKAALLAALMDAVRSGAR